MAVFPSKECPWTITGESSCGENFANAPAIAKLGEYCDYKSCKEGSCIRINSQSPSVCTMVLAKGAKGCSKDNYVCDRDLKCNNDICQSVTDKSQTMKDGSDVDKMLASSLPSIKKQTMDYDKLALYVFMALMGSLLVVMIILLFSAQIKSE